MALPKSRGEIRRIQSQRKRVAVEQAMRSPFWRKRLPEDLSLDRLDDPEVWRSIPILDKDMLRAMTDAQFYGEFCLQEHDGIAEYWRSGGVTGQPLFYPRSFRDMEAGLESFARTFDCAGARARRSRARLVSDGHPPGGAGVLALRRLARHHRELGRLGHLDAFRAAARADPAPEADHLARHVELRAAPGEPRGNERHRAVGQDRHDLRRAGVEGEARQDRAQLGRKTHRHLRHDRGRDDGRREQGR